MLSAAQNMVAIMTWLLEFLRTGNLGNPKFPLPKEVVTEFDKALRGAVSRVFSEAKSLKDYLKNCFHVIMGDKDEFSPASRMRAGYCWREQDEIDISWNLGQSNIR